MGWNSYVRCALARGAAALLLVLLSLAAVPAGAAESAADRMQLHRNANRGIPYMELARTGAAASSGTIAMKATAQIALDGNALDNAHGNLYPIDTDGNGTFEFVHFNGYRFMRVYDAAGNKLWQISNPKGRLHRDAIHRDSLAVLDADGNGTQEIFHCWLDPASGRKQLVERSGRTGAVIRSVNLDASAGSECQIAAFRVAGRSTPIVLVAETNKSGCAKEGNYIDTWGRTVAFDVNLTRLWDRNTCYAGHYAYPVDSNDDGLAERIFVGRHLYDPSGNRICTLEIGTTHADGVVTGDLEPGRPGLEAVAVGATGLRGFNAANCQLLWSVPQTTVVNPQTVSIARRDAGSTALSLVVQQKGTASNPYLYFLDGRGKVRSRYPRSTIDGSTPSQNANLDGATGTDDVVFTYGRVIDPSGRLRLGTDWYWSLKGSKVTPVASSIKMDNWATYALVLDLDRDGRDEMVVWGQTLIVVGKAGGAVTPAPVAVADSATTAGTAVTIDVLANDSGAGLTIASSNNPAKGSKTTNADQTFTYTPRAGYDGSDSFQYTIRDGNGRTASATVTVTISGAGAETIRIVSSIYGAAATCDPTTTISAACEGRGGCEISVGGNLCGDPQVGTPKRLTVEYACGTERRNAIGLDHGTAFLTCGNGGMRIATAVYGSAANTCTATNLVSGICKWRDSCAVMSDTLLCGDPNMGIAKNLRITYNCDGVGKSITAANGTAAGLACP